MSKEIRDQVNAIVETLENPPLFCQFCEITHDHDDIEDGETCPDCGDAMYGMSAGDYLTTALDLEYTVNSDREYIGASVLVCFGGPSVTINTRFSRVEGHWWGDTHTVRFNDEMGLDEYLKELFEMGA